MMMRTGRSGQLAAKAMGKKRFDASRSARTLRLSNLAFMSCLVG